MNVDLIWHENLLLGMFGLRTRYSFEGYRSKRLFCEAVVSSRGKPGRHLLRSTGMAFDSPGFFTGALTSTDSLPHDDVRRTHPRFSEENLKKNLPLLRPIEEIAREKGCTPAQLALAWLLAKGNDIVPIPGTKRRKYLEENVGALNIRLSAADIARISNAVPPGAATGLRYPERTMAAVNR